MGVATSPELWKLQSIDSVFAVLEIQFNYTHLLNMPSLRKAPFHVIYMCTEVN